MIKAFIKNAEFGISLLFIFVAICLAYIAIPAFGNKALIVRSGSMEPTVKVGDLVVVQTQHGLLVPQPLVTHIYKEGDIIAFKDSKNPKIVVTHRIIGKEIKDGKIYYQTKGDANNAQDNVLIAEENIVGKAMFSVAGIGKIFAFAKSKYGFGLMIVFPALMVIIFEIINIINEIKKKRSVYQTQTPPTTNAAASLKTLIPLALSIFVIHNSLAYFSDTGTSTNNIFAADDCFGAGSHIVINEVFYDVDTLHNGLGSENDWEWVELFNPTASPVSLTGWSIADGNSSDTFPGTPSLQPCSFAIVSPSTESELEDQTNDGGNWTIPDGTLFITLSSPIGNGLANGGDRVVLKNSSSTEIDKMSYGTDKTGFSSGCTATACPSVASGHSLERNPDGLDTDAAGDFVDRNPPTPGS